MNETHGKSATAAPHFSRDYGTVRLLVHKESFKNEELVINPKSFPGFLSRCSFVSHKRKRGQGEEREETSREQGIKRERERQSESERERGRDR